MKIVTTMEENKSVVVQRFDGELEVGCRTVSIADYCHSLISQLPLGSHFKYMVDNLDEFEAYFNALEEPLEFAKFISEIIKAAPRDWLENHSVVLELIDAALTRLDYITVDTPEINELIKTVALKTPELQLDNTLYQVLQRLITLALKSNSKSVQEDLSNFVYGHLLRLLKNEQQDEILHLLENIIPHLDSNWVSNLMLEAVRKSKKTLSFYSGPMPKDVDFLSVTTRGITYVYDVPAQQIEVNYKGSKLGKIGHPRLLFLYQLNSDGMVSSMRLYAAKSNDQLNDEITVYRYPYSNVFNNGRVCWDYSDITIEMLPSAAELFLSAENSSHLKDSALDVFLEFKEKSFDENKLQPLAKFKDVL